MARIPHGGRITIEQAKDASEKSPFGMLALGVPVSPGGPDFHRFGYLFSDLQQDDANLLPVTPETVANLKRLGQSMQDQGPGVEGNSSVPAAYTYLGQFIDHDLTFELSSGKLAQLNDPALAPLAPDDIEEKIKNTRSAKFDLDSVYGGLAQRDEDDNELALGIVTVLDGNQSPPRQRPAGKDEFNDLPRKGFINKKSLDREALIGDPRNDENTVVSQLHLAFLRSHNAIVARGNDFENARKLLRQHYQWLVVYDFLIRIADIQIVAATIAENRFFNPDPYDFFMPLEFSVAAYRFGHSMVRTDYDFNLNFNTGGAPGTFPATLDLLFTFSALSGNLGSQATGGENPTLPEKWIIEWERFVDLDGDFNHARRFDTKLVEPLSKLKFFDGTVLPDEARLAVRNLLRGYLLRMPTGQAVAGALGIAPLTAAELESAAASSEQTAALSETGFNARTPLWYYILAEAAHFGGDRLGPVGSTLIAEVIIGLIRRSDDSILDGGNFSPSLGRTAGQFDLPDLLRLANVLA